VRLDQVVAGLAALPRPLALDGKTVCGSQEPVQLLSAFATQVRGLLEGLDLTRWSVTGDAKLTQKAIVEKIVAQEGT
jgi:hypothetical protein